MIYSKFNPFQLVIEENARREANRLKGPGYYPKRPNPPPPAPPARTRLTLEERGLCPRCAGRRDSTPEEFVDPDDPDFYCNCCGDEP